MGRSSTPARSCSRASCRRSRAARERYVAGIGLGNEPDISYGYDLPRYLADLAAYRDAGVTRPYAIVAPSTSETIAPWQSIAARTSPTRFFWDWPAILDAIAPAMKAVRTVHGTLATDHFYPLARGCTTDDTAARRSSGCCPTSAWRTSPTRSTPTRPWHAARPRLPPAGDRHRGGPGRRRRLERRRRRDLGARGDARVGLPAAAERAGRERRLRDGRGRHQPPQRRGQPVLRARGGQRVLQRDRLRPVARAGAAARRRRRTTRCCCSRASRRTRAACARSRSRPEPTRRRIRAWEVDAGREAAGGCSSTSRARPLTAAVAAPGGRYEIDRMTPFDPTGAGRTLDAPQVRIDGRAVAADGSWPGFAPTAGRIARGQVRVALARGRGRGRHAAPSLTRPRERTMARDIHYFAYGTLQQGLSNYADMGDVLGEPIGRFRTLDPFAVVVPHEPGCANPRCNLLHRMAMLVPASARCVRRATSISSTPAGCASSTASRTTTARRARAHTCAARSTSSRSTV